MPFPHRPAFMLALVEHESQIPMRGRADFTSKRPIVTQTDPAAAAIASILGILLLWVGNQLRVKLGVEIEASRMAQLRDSAEDAVRIAADTYRKEDDDAGRNSLMESAAVQHVQEEARRIGKRVAERAAQKLVKSAVRKLFH